MIELNNDNFNENVSTGLVFVDFFAPWCGPCTFLTPLLEQLSLEFKNTAKFFKVNVDNSNDLAQQFNVMSVPTIIIFKDSVIVETIVGVVSKDVFVEQIKNFA